MYPPPKALPMSLHNTVHEYLPCNVIAGDEEALFADCAPYFSDPGPLSVNMIG